MSLGFEQAGFDVLAAFELEQLHVDTYNKNRTTHVSYQIDLAKARIKTLLELAKTVPGEVDVVFGGPPCQGFSYGGVNDPKDPRNALVKRFAKIVVGIQPRAFVMENVAGLLSQKNRCILYEMISIMRKGGYVVAAPRILNAKNYGIPQKRQRVFVIGIRKGQGEPAYPEQISGEVTVQDALGDLPGLRGSSFLEDDIFVGDLKKPSAYASSLRSSARLTILTGCQLTLHSDSVIQRFQETKPGKQEPVSRFHRLAWNGQSNTLRAGTGSDKSSHTAPRPIHPKYPRCITTREAARLHGYPDNFNFHAAKWHAFRQIGNSVPPPLANLIANSIMKSLEDIRP